MGANRVESETGKWIGYYENDSIQEGWTMIFEPIPENSSYYILQWDFNLLVWKEGATPTEVENINNRLNIEDIKQKYEFHRANGWEYYQEFRAKVVTDIEEGVITELEAFYIEENLNIAFDQISSTGDWKTARYKLTQVTPYPEFVQPYYDYALNLINQYINNNYEN